MKGRVVGLIVLAVIVIAALVWQFAFRGKVDFGAMVTGKTVTVKGYIGSEKTGFLEDDAVKSLLRRKYGIVVDYSKAGSIEMVRGSIGPDIDFLWPSSEIALEMYRQARDNATVKSQIVFSSPLVLYSWDLVSTALVKAGIVTAQADTLQVTGFPRLLSLCMEGAKWSDIGVPDLFGKVTITSTDPNKSNSGMMFAALVANVLQGDVVDESTVQPIIPRLASFFARLGYMESSTGILFEQYLRTGVGSYPLIVGYENQIVEFSLQNPDLWPRVKGSLRILYPVPTVWASHPLIALTSKAERLMEALKDPEVQKLAWEKHGFRTGLTGAQNDPARLTISGIATVITKVSSMPKPQVIDQILSALQGGTQ